MKDSARLSPGESVGVASTASLPWGDIVLATVGAIIFAITFGSVLIENLRKIGRVGDWNFYLARDWASAYTVSRFHQLPLWNPYECGGMQMLASPQARIGTPFFLLHILLGSIVGLHLEILLDLAIAWSGGYFLARILGLSPLAAIACGSIFPSSSWFGLHVGAGHLNFLTSLYLPWIVALTWHSMTRDTILTAGLAALFMAMTVGGAGVYQVTQAALLVGVIATGVAIQRRSLMPFAMLALFACFSLGFSAIKLLPTYVFMLSHPRTVSVSEYNSALLLLDALLSRNQARGRVGHVWDYSEYGAYIGIFAALMLLVGVASAPRRAMPWVLAGAVMFALAMGEVSANHSPWRLLHYLPVFSQERVALRFLIPFVMAVSVLAGFGIDLIQRSLGLVGRIAAMIFVTLCIFDLWDVGRANLMDAVDADPPPIEDRVPFHQLYAESVGSMFELSRSNTGAMHCYDVGHGDGTADSPTRVTGSNQAGYRGEQYLLGPGTVTLSRWSPNELSFKVATQGANSLVINQNFDDGWRLIENRGDIMPFKGLLAVRLKPGTQTVTLKYTNRYFSIGAMVTFLSLGIFVALVNRGRLIAFVRRFAVRFSASVT